MDLAQIFFTTLAVSFGILHLILYLFDRRLKSNLFFSLFLFLYALNIFFDYQALLTTGMDQLFYLRIHRLVVPYNSLFALLFLYYAFNFKIPTYFWGLTSVVIITGLLSVLKPIQYFPFVQVAFLFVIAEAIRILFSGIRLKKDDAWILFTGIILLFFFSFYDLLMDLNVISSIAEIKNGYPFGFVGLIVCSSIYLASSFARANRQILRKEREAQQMEMQKKLLEAEDQRKASELKDARELQLSLLPQQITELDHYEFYFRMEPAAEVGGDYYDYFITDSNKLTLVIGDATNHGMKAGMMVSIMKSLFMSHIENMGIKDFLNHCSQIIKQMNLRTLFMALMVVKINGSSLRVSSAGIPPLLIYRSKTKTIEEIKTKGMPLGALHSFPYQIAQTDLNDGDTILMMTDGLAELFNKNRVAFGDERIKTLLAENAEEPVSEIIDSLFSAAKKWTGKEKQNDDITLAAFRFKG